MRIVTTQQAVFQYEQGLSGFRVRRIAASGIGCGRHKEDEKSALCDKAGFPGHLERLASHFSMVAGETLLFMRRSSRIRNQTA